MKRLVITAALATLAAMPVIAQDHSQHSAPAAKPAPATPTAPAAAPTTAAKFSLDTPVETLMADPAAKAVVEANVPGISTHESYDMFKSMSLTQLSGMAPDKLTPDVLAKTQAGLAAIR